MGSILGGAVFLATVFANAKAADQAPQTSECTFELRAAGTISRVLDGETVELSDATGERTGVRLVGALAPRGRYPDRPWPVEQAAKAALEELVAGKTLFLPVGQLSRDRYGIVLAQAFVEQADGTRVWVQGAMLRRGHARAYNLPGHSMCLTDLLAHELAARSASLSIWNHKSFRHLDAARGAELQRFRNTFQMVEGTVFSVETSRDWTYLNFGPDRRTDFTIGWRASAHEPISTSFFNRLKDQRVRVRGWIERRGGPFIAVWDLKQIELLDAAAAPGSIGASTDPPRPQAIGVTNKKEPD